MSDEEEQYVSEDETQSDFSASEDEWPGTDDDTESSDSDFQDDICSNDEVMDKPKDRATSSLSTRVIAALSDATQPRTKKCLSQSVRNKSYNKCRPQLSLNSVIKCTTQNVSAHLRVSNTLKTSKYTRKIPAESLRHCVRVTISRSIKKSNLLARKRD